MTNIRKFIDIINESNEINIIVYHGTTEKSWGQSGETDELHVTTIRKEAELFAEETAISECEGLDEEEWHLVKPIVVKFNLATLLSLPNITPMADSGLIRGGFNIPDNDWKASLKECGFIRLDGFTDEMKKFGEIEIAY